MKKLLLLCLTALCALTAWAYDFYDETSGIYYNFLEDGSSVAVTWGGSSATASDGTPEYTGNFIVPETVEHEGVEYAITTIGDHAFYSCAITGLTMFNNITSIEDDAFHYCRNLTTITIPSSVTSIGSNAFNACSGLTSITFPESVTQIEEGTCNSCTSLEEVIIGSNVTYISENAFANNTSLKRFYSLSSTPPECYYLDVGGMGIVFQTSFYNTNIGECTLYVPIGSIDTYKETQVWEDFGSIEEIEEEDDDGKFMVDGIYYELNSDGENTVSVTWGSADNQSGTETYTGDIDIPSTVRRGITTYTVTAIGSWAFVNCTLTSVIIPSSVTRIEERAFGYCANLESVTIPDEVTTIGQMAFYECSSLPSITLPSNLSIIDDYLFYNCKNLKNVTISDELTSIGERVFYNCASLEEIIIPDKVTSIGRGTFWFCSNLKSITFGASIASIGTSMFEGCTALIEIYSLNPTPPSVENGSFGNSPSTETCVVNVPQGARMAYSTATVWQDFFNIKEIGSEVENPIVMTGNVSDITKDTATLYGTVSAGSEEILGRGFQYWADTNGRQTIVATTVSDDEISSTIQRLSSATEYTYRAYALTESGYTYGENKTFTTTNYDFFVDDIYYYKLSNSTVAVNYLYYASTDNSIAYKGEVNIPSTVSYSGTTYRVTTINDYAFYECHDLTKVTIPESVTAIGPYSFYNCTSLEEAALPNTISAIWDYSFYGCASLKEVVIPSSVTTIRQRAFVGCNSITELIVPGTVKTLETATFANCANLKKVTVEEGVTNTGYSYMFAGCTSLEDVSLPNTMTEMGSYTFGGCTSLKEIKLPKGITELGAGTFYECSSLTSVKLPEGITEISTGLFGYSGITSVTIPDAVTQLCTNAFRNTAISSLTIPQNVTYLQGWILYGCTDVKKVYALNPEPAECQLAYSGSDGSVVRPFTGMPSTCVLYVPTGTKEDYSTADGWEGFFADIIEFDVLSAETLEAQDITDSSATLKGSVTEGTFDMTEKGFEYWTGYDDATVVVVSDNEMTASITDLAYGTTYSYRAYAIDETGTRYGDTLTFTTDVPEGISSVNPNDSDVEGYYSISGLKLNAPQKGINIVRYADGTTKKVIIK